MVWTEEEELSSRLDSGELRPREVLEYFRGSTMAMEEEPSPEER